MWIVNGIVIVLLLYVFFVFMPGFCAFFFVFTHRECNHLTAESMKGGYYEPYAEAIVSSAQWIHSHVTEKLSVQAEDGLELTGEYVKQETNSDKLVIFFHGYKADPVDQFAVTAKALYDKGYSLLFTCQRGHGENKGKYTTLGMLEQQDVSCWVKKAEDMGAKQIVLYGMSMGCAAVSFAASSLDKNCVKALILDCGYSSPKEQMKEDGKKWFLPPFVIFPAMSIAVKLFLHLDMKRSVRASLEASVIPAFFIHGTADDSVLVKHGIDNFECYGGPKEQVLVEGANHTLGMLKGGAKAQEKLFGFLNQYIRNETEDENSTL